MSLGFGLQVCEEELASMKRGQYIPAALSSSVKCNTDLYTVIQQEIKARDGNEGYDPNLNLIRIVAKQQEEEHSELCEAYQMSLKDRDTQIQRMQDKLRVQEDHTETQARQLSLAQDKIPELKIKLDEAMKSMKYTNKHAESVSTLL